MEIVTGQCVRYTGPAIPCLEITNGMDLNLVIQKIAAKLCECCDTPEQPLCAVPNITTQVICSEDGDEFFIKVFSDHIASHPTVAFEYKSGSAGAAWQDVGQITTTGVAANDFLTIQQPIDSSTTSVYYVRARRRCGGNTHSEWTTQITITTPSCSTPPPLDCPEATSLFATPI